MEGPRPKFARTDGGEGGSHPSNVHDHVYAIGEPRWLAGLVRWFAGSLARWLAGSCYGQFCCSAASRAAVAARQPLPQRPTTPTNPWPSPPSPPPTSAGTINFTGDMPVALLVDGPSLGGFVCPATITTTELWKMGQVRPGDAVRFKKLTVSEVGAGRSLVLLWSRLVLTLACCLRVDCLPQAPAAGFPS